MSDRTALGQIGPKFVKKYFELCGPIYFMCEPIDALYTLRNTREILYGLSEVDVQRQA